MSDLTISKLIKLIIAGVVLVVVILGLYFAMTSYIIPFFKGLGFGSEGFGEEILGEVCEEENLVGSLEKEGDLLYFKYEDEKTVFYIKEEKVYEDRWGIGNDEGVGEIVGNEIIIFSSVLIGYSRNKAVTAGTPEFQKFQQLLALEHSVIKGNEICKP